MSSFMSKAACRGRRPSQFLSYNGYQRSVLIGRLLKERNVARFIVAPSGYGKTCLMADYAETIFGWAHTFFVNGQSPCFLRDLDAGQLASQCLSVDKGARLVVFDDVPMLDAKRAQLFSDEIDALIGKGCEVVVACTPMCDAFSLLQRDRVCLSARDLLLSDEELDEARSAEERAHAPSSSLSAAARVPALVWDGGLEAAESFVKQTVKEQMPADLLYVIMSMLVIRAGSIRSIERICSVDVEEICDLLDSYPHLGYDAETGTFEAPALPISCMAPTVKRDAQLLVSKSTCRSWEELSRAWASALLEDMKDAARACEVVTDLVPRAGRAKWLSARVRPLIAAGCYYPALQAIRSIGSSGAKSLESKASMAVLEAVCRHMLDDDEGAVRCVKRFAFDDGISQESRICALLVLARYGASTQSKRAADSLAEISAGVRAGDRGGGSPAELLAFLWCESMQSSGALIDAWRRCQSLGAEDYVLCLGASWLFGLIAVELDNGVMAAGEHESYAPVERYVRSRLESQLEGGRDFIVALAGLSMERAHMRGMVYTAGPLPSRQLFELRRVELHVLGQRQQFEHDFDEEKARASNWVETHPDAVTVPATALISPYAHRSVPVLSLKLFGSFEAYVGDDPINSAFFRRQSIKSLLVLLAINEGKELSRDAIERAMWPKSSERVARKNFYAIWSQLRSVLMLSDGTCPYLIRHQYGCSLETRHVQSDIKRFNEICRELQFGYASHHDWPGLYAEIEHDFASDLMPSEKNNPLIIEARAECRARLVDALVAGSAGVVDEGNPQWGIWFARAAIERERTREDAYVALMRAQIAAEQRTAAIMTYHKCRKILAEELGVDPSPEVQALYQSLIDAE